MRMDQCSSDRFQFGENWLKFLDVLDESRIEYAIQSICANLDVKNLSDKSFLDIGSGSGLFSLAARRLGARVHSFDYDPHSVACTAELKRRYFIDDAQWLVEQGSALDQEYLNRLGGDLISSIVGACCTTRVACGRHWRMSCRLFPLEGSCLSQSITIREELAKFGQLLKGYIIVFLQGCGG